MRMVKVGFKMKKVNYIVEQWVLEDGYWFVFRKNRMSFGKISSQIRNVFC